VQDGTSPVIYANGVAIAQSFTTSTDKTKWLNDCAGIDNARIGDRNYSSLGEDSHFNGDIGQVRYYNRALTAKEIENNYNNMKHRYL
jgi:hypothetical protein